MNMSTMVADIGQLADRTPPDRDRVVDAMRAASILVVVAWHWSLSITHRDAAGHLVNPNPLPEIPLGWAGTWLLQVIPIFFIVGGFANRIRWSSTVEGGGGVREFLVDRGRRILAPTAVFIAVWLLIDLVAQAVIEDHSSLFQTALIVFAPLWFVAAYMWVVALVPITARLHDRHPLVTLVALFTIIAFVDLIRFGLGNDAAGLVNTALVWVVVHQLGYFWPHGTSLRPSRPLAIALAIGGLASIALLTSLEAYPRSLVNTAETDISHMFPTTAVVAVLAVTQFGFMMWARPWLAGKLERRRPWMIVLGVNAVILTVFLWHMTALHGTILIFEAMGGTLPSEPTATWWLTRPLWLLAPALLLIPLIAIFGPIERWAQSS